MPEGKLLGRVILTCLGRVEVLELPRGTPVAELLSKAAKLFGRGRLTDRAGHVVTPKDSKLDGGFYTWSPEGASDPGRLYVCRKGESRWPHLHEYADYIEPEEGGEYRYGDLTANAGYVGWLEPKCVILGEPEIMRIYPTEKGVVFIDRTKLGDWGTKGKPVPLVAVDVHRQSAAKASFVSWWWGTIKEFIAPPAPSTQPHGVGME